MIHSREMAEALGQVFDLDHGEEIMLTLESANTYLDRRRKALAFFETIPDAQVDLADWVREDHYAEHFQLPVEGAIRLSRRGSALSRADARPWSPGPRA